MDFSRASTPGPAWTSEWCPGRRRLTVDSNKSTSAHFLLPVASSDIRLPERRSNIICLSVWPLRTQWSKYKNSPVTVSSSYSTLTIQYYKISFTLKNERSAACTGLTWHCSDSKASVTHGRWHYSVCGGKWVSVAVRLVANCYTPFTLPLLYLT